MEPTPLEWIFQHVWLRRRDPNTPAQNGHMGPGAIITLILVFGILPVSFTVFFLYRMFAKRRKREETRQGKRRSPIPELNTAYTGSGGSLSGNHDGNKQEEWEMVRRPSSTEVRVYGWPDPRPPRTEPVKHRFYEGKEEAKL
ncbi:hypothetical protein MKZ38_006419 [Zalerion maritima]|uniref:Uncharacterized protein n=1 Tax=Zalerion maritima TaxID=339359 RepID=A0AAD5WPR3_9PEZI|nr:hypothetical protein MKZ38_006419 [Zalerion maritima]